MRDETCTESPPRTGQSGSHVASSMQSAKESVEESTDPASVTTESSSDSLGQTLITRLARTQAEDETSVEKEAASQQEPSITVDMEHLTRGIDQLSVSKDAAPPRDVHAYISSDKKETQYPSERSRHKPTAQSIIATLRALKLKSRGLGHQSPLVAHGPLHGIPCRTVTEQPTFQGGYDQSKRKRGAPEAYINPYKFYREKGPSEQDERDNYLPNLEEDVFDIFDYLTKQTGDIDMINTVLDDVGTLNGEGKEEVASYINEERKKEAVMPVPNELPMYQTRMSPSQQVPRSPEYAPSPASSGYGTMEEVLSPVPSLPPESPASSVDCFSDNSNPGMTPYVGIMDNMPKNMLNMEVFNNNLPRQQSQEYHNGGVHQQVAMASPQFPPIDNDDIIKKQLMNMGQTQITEIAPQFVISQQPQPLLQQPQQQPQQVQQQQPQLRLLAQQSPTSGVLQVTTLTHVIPNPTISSSQMRSVNGNISPTRNCGCGSQNCIHVPIAPKPDSGTPPTPVLPIPINRPPPTKSSDIIERLPRSEMLGARRWVASIKTTELPNTDSDGDLSLHIVVCQADRPRLIALLERCKREKIVENLINQQNHQTQSLLFMAVLATPETSAADMVAILVENDADPLVRTVLTRKNAMDMEYRYPIHVLAHKGNVGVPIMSELLAKKRDEQLSIVCDSGHTALHYAALAHRVRPSNEMIRHLLMQGADINAKEGKRGRSALHYMVETQDFQMLLEVLYLLGRDRAKQAVKVTTYDGCTALHIAAGLKMDLNSHKMMLRILIDHGAEVGAKNTQGQRAADLIPQDKRELLGVLKCGSLKGMPSPPYQRQYQI